MKRFVAFLFTSAFLLGIVARESPARGTSGGCPASPVAVCGGDSVPARGAWQGTFYCAETRVSLVLDLYAASLDLPGYAFLGKTHGYMQGDTGGCLYGLWMVTQYQVKGEKGEKAVLRLSNDLGSDAQEIELTFRSDGTLHYRARGGNAVRKAVGRKLVKIPAEMVFRRK